MTEPTTHMESNTTIILKDPAELRLHKLQAHIPAPDKKSSEWVAFIDSIHAGGILHPLLITKDGQIMDGGWRWRAAMQLEMAEVPCLVREEAEAAVIITESLLHRKQMTRGAAVYLALSLVKDFVESAESRRRSNLMRGHKTREIPLKSPNGSDCRSETIAEICQRWGVSEKTYREAVDVQKIFASNSEFKKEWEPKLLRGDASLWNVKSAFGGSNADQSKRNDGVEQKQMEFWTSAFKPICQRVSFWKKLNGEKREVVLQQWREDAADLPQDLRKTMAEVLLEGVE